MQTRKEDDYCPLTLGMWEGAISCTEGINTSFGDCITDEDTSKLCFVVAFASGGAAGISFCAGWLLCCSLPPVVATAFTPVTGLIDCCIFSAKKIGSKCADGPERQMMEDGNKKTNYNSLTAR